MSSIFDQLSQIADDFRNEYAAFRESKSAANEATNAEAEASKDARA